MAEVKCRSCKGKGKYYPPNSNKFYDCRACDGKGTDKNWWSTKCERCREEIVYKANTPTPRFCKNCRNVELTKSCGQHGCNTTIRYKVGWDNVSTYCKRCETKRKENWSASTCPGLGLFGCGKLIWSPPGKRFNLCPDCGAKKKADDDAKWREKKCPGLKSKGYCGKTIRYRIDWDKVSDICKDCKAESIAEREKREANKRTKPCVNCGSTITYYADGHEPFLCKTCRDKKLKIEFDTNQKGSSQAKLSNGTLLFTFGKCLPPRADRIGGDADRRRDWANRGYWWVSMPGNPHETFIVSKNPVEKGFISFGEAKDVSYSSPALRFMWSSLAITIANME